MSSSTSSSCFRLNPEHQTHAGLSAAFLPLHLLLLNLKPVQLTGAAELFKSDFKLSLHSGAEGEEPTTGGGQGGERRWEEGSKGED